MLENSMPNEDVHHNIHDKLDSIPKLDVIVMEEECNKLMVLLMIRRWKAWEAEISSHGYDKSSSANCIAKFVGHHATFWAKAPVFYTVHLSRESTFNFQEHIKRSLEDDFKVVVGISPLLWAFFVVSLLLNVYKWDVMFRTSLITPVMILAVNTKLHAILSDMSLDITERLGVIQRNPEKYFWFGKPRFVLDRIHFSLFESAFQITYCIWLWSSFDRITCLNVDIKPSIFKIALGLGMIFICSYISLPLYVLVTQTVTRKRSTSVELRVSSVGSMHGSTTSHSSRSISANEIEERPTSTTLMYSPKWKC